MFAVRSRRWVLPPRRPFMWRAASRCVYAIRNIVAEAKRVEADGTRGAIPEYRRPDCVRIPDAPKLIEAVERAWGWPQRLRSVVRIASAREAVAEELHVEGCHCRRPVVLTSGTRKVEWPATPSSRRRRSAGACSDLSLYTAVSRSWVRGLCSTTDGMPPAAGCQISKHQKPDHPATGSSSRSIRTTPQEMSTGGGAACAGRPVGGARAPAARGRGVCRPCVRRPRERHCRAQPRCTGHHVLVAFEGVSRAGLARGMDGGRTDLPDGRCAAGGEEAGRWPAVRDRTHGVRHHGRPHRRSQPQGGVRAALRAAPS